MRRRSLLAGVAAGVASAEPAEEIALWPGAPPDGKGPEGPERVDAWGAITGISRPRLIVWRPAWPNGVAMMVAAGGGYDRVERGKESAPAARWLSGEGFVVFELIYRLPAEGWTRAAPFQDGSRAMRIIRGRARGFGIDPARIGAPGFSAGGHLVAMLCVAPDRPRVGPVDAPDGVDARPEFAGLIYPVITMLPPDNHTRAFRAVLGQGASQAEMAALSPETLVTRAAPGRCWRSPGTIRCPRCATAC